MSIFEFPGAPKDLILPYDQMVTDGKAINLNTYSVENPHPGFGKDPNILNELGHTKYPMWVGKIIVNNEEEEKTEREKLNPKTELRTDGPTLQEYIAKGYKASHYPPNGYTSKATKEEIDAAIRTETFHNPWPSK